MNNHISTFKLLWRERPGGGGRTARSFLDFVVDGRSLYDLLSAKGYDSISCLGWFVPEHDKQAVQTLLLRRAPELKAGRIPLYVCPECGDIECGAVTIKIAKEGNYFVWRDFGFESDQSSGCLEEAKRDFADVGPYYFNKTEYWEALNNYLSTRYSKR